MLTTTENLCDMTFHTSQASNSLNAVSKILSIKKKKNLTTLSPQVSVTKSFHIYSVNLSYYDFQGPNISAAFILHLCKYIPCYVEGKPCYVNSNYYLSSLYEPWQLSQNNAGLWAGWSGF